MTPSETDPVVHHLTGESRDALTAIVSGCVMLVRDPMPPALLDLKRRELDALMTESDEDVLDELAGDDVGTLEEEEAALDDALNELGDAYGPIMITVRILVRSVLARTLDRTARTHIGPNYLPGTNHPEPDGAMLDALARALTQPAPVRYQPSRPDHNAAVDFAAVLFREIGLEEFGVSCDLDDIGDGSYQLVTQDISSEAAHLDLLEFLFDRAENVALSGNPLLATERDASSWEFMQWSVAAPPGRGRGDPDATEFARHVREQEYSLVDRPTVSLGVPLVEAIADETFAELFPRQYRMAMALRASVVGVFECVALEGNRATMRSIRDGSTYVVHDQLQPIEYSPGWVAAGRLLPFDNAVHLRSPGMVFTPARHLDLMSGARNDVGKLEHTHPPAIAVEAFISAAFLGVQVPRVTKPARSKADARDMVTALREVVADAEVTLDSTLEAYVAALAAQAESGSPGRGSAGAGVGRKAKGTGKRRR